MGLTAWMLLTIFLHFRTSLSSQDMKKSELDSANAMWAASAIPNPLE